MYVFNPSTSANIVLIVLHIAAFPVPEYIEDTELPPTIVYKETEGKTHSARKARTY